VDFLHSPVLLAPSTGPGTLGNYSRMNAQKGAETEQKEGWVENGNGVSQGGLGARKRRDSHKEAPMSMQCVDRLAILTAGRRAVSAIHFCPGEVVSRPGCEQCGLNGPLVGSEHDGGGPAPGFRAR
jgi:hypothetical protein